MKRYILLLILFPTVLLALLNSCTKTAPMGSAVFYVVVDSTGIPSASNLSITLDVWPATTARPFYSGVITNILPFDPPPSDARIYSSPVISCPERGCANFNIPVGDYRYEALGKNGYTHSGTFTVTEFSCNKIQL